MTALSTDERDELAHSVRAACEKFASEERVRAVAYDHDRAQGGFDSELWKVLCTQVGVAAIALPEHLGGAGYGASAPGEVVMKELGFMKSDIDVKKYSDLSLIEAAAARLK